MTAINRCAVGIGPRQPLVDWVRQVSGGHELCWGANEDGLYLLPEYEDNSQAILVLEENYDLIFEAELQSWCRDPARWPRPRTFAMFQEWFEIRFYDLVDDLSREELRHLEVDQALVEQVRQTLQEPPSP